METLRAAEALTLGVQCPCVVNHVPVPRQLHNHHIIPKYLGGPDTAANTIYICPNTHYNIHEIIEHWEKNEKPPFRVNAFTFNLAKQGWEGRTV